MRSKTLTLQGFQPSFQMSSEFGLSQNPLGPLLGRGFAARQGSKSSQIPDPELTLIMVVELLTPVAIEPLLG